MNKITTFTQLIRYCYVEYIRALYACIHLDAHSAFLYLRANDMHNGICLFISSLIGKKLITKTNAKKWCKITADLAFADQEQSYLFETPSDVRFSNHERRNVLIAIHKRVLWLYFMTDLIYYEEQITYEEVRRVKRRITQRR